SQYGRRRQEFWRRIEAAPYRRFVGLLENSASPSPKLVRQQIVTKTAQRLFGGCLETTPGATYLAPRHDTTPQPHHRPHATMPLDRKIRYGMVGGGPGAFIGGVHR